MWTMNHDYGIYEQRDYDVLLHHVQESDQRLQDPNIHETKQHIQKQKYSRKI